DPRRRRRLQLHPAAPDLHQPLIRPDGLHEPMAKRLWREPADDTDHRNHALAADRGHPRPRHLGCPRIDRGHLGRLLHARGGDLSTPRACPRSLVRLRADMAGTSGTWSTRSTCTTSSVAWGLTRAVATGFE